MISIAAVDGEAWGHGAELAWACDLRVASTASTFGQPEINVGTCPGSGGTVRLARLVGEATCLRLVLDGMRSRPDTIELVRGAQARYEAGGDTYAAFGLLPAAD